jgi:(p)ppGpp synthase/HD superfamily hydrolase
MDKKLKNIEEDYLKIKNRFQEEDNLLLANEIAGQMKEHEAALKKVFSFLINAFRGRVRNDRKTPLVFHSIYLTRLAYLFGEKDLDSLLVSALHDVLEDTEISEDFLIKQSFMIGKKHVMGYLEILKEKKELSREPDGENLPPRYAEHIKRLIGAQKEVVNTEILDRFSDLMDLEYIMELPEKEKNLRLKSKLIKVKGFVYSITKNRKDFNKNCLDLFESKVKDCEEKWGIIP